MPKKNVASPGGHPQNKATKADEALTDRLGSKEGAAVKDVIRDDAAFLLDNYRRDVDNG